MSATDLLFELQGLGVQIWEDCGRLRYRSPKGVMTAERIGLLREQKTAVLNHLRERGGHEEILHDPQSRHQSFPLTDIQAAYLLGRANAFTYGGIGCHAYGELVFRDLDPGRLEAAWQRLIERHDMLRAVVDPSGFQQVLANVPRYCIDVADLRDAGAEAFHRHVLKVRGTLDHKVYPTRRWPLFDLAVTRGAEQAILHFSIDFLIADYVSIHLLLDELHVLYEQPTAELPPIAITFRDYLKAKLLLDAGPAYQADREWWWTRIDELPPAPVLPLRGTFNRVADFSTIRFRRLAMALIEAQWSELQLRARKYGLTPSAVLLAAYADVIAFWSEAAQFTLNVTLLQRPELHPDIAGLVGDFTSVDLVTVAFEKTQSFLSRAKAVQRRLWSDLDHCRCSGVEAMREIVRRRGPAAALMPIVFTSAIGLGGARGACNGRSSFGESNYSISQTPQVWIDCQAMERDSGLSINWDVREAVFPDGLPEDMFAAFEHLVRQLAASDLAWHEPETVRLPALQQESRRRANATRTTIPDRLLHVDIVARAASQPTALAIIDDRQSLNFTELVTKASAIAAYLLDHGCLAGEIVAVGIDKCADQIVAVLGILLAGGVYLPIERKQPPARWRRIVTDAGVRFVLTTASDVGTDAWPENVRLVAIEQVLRLQVISTIRAPQAAPDDLAYVIYTSGSTGSPKGVSITHRSALNTLDDINQRFAVGQADRLLGLSSLGFDLSVYDIFGVLGAGGCLVLPRADRRNDPAHWADLIEQHRVTMWNSVPAQLQMLNDHLAFRQPMNLASLRLALISGDWIPVTLPDQIRSRLPQLQLVSLGGATEAAIWSIIQPIGEVPATWRSIPYGKPLANQTFHILDAALRARPDWVPGELYIGGIGLARGYLGDQVLSDSRFFQHPNIGARLYRTGDIGRYWPDGTIEFLGREDFQVKIRGNRVELAEIESILQAMPGVDRVVVLATGETARERKLVALLEPAPHCGEAVDGPGMGAIVGAGEAAGRAILASLDLAHYCEYLRHLDTTALLEMLSTLTHSGLFTDTSASHSLEQIIEALAAKPVHHRLVRRWLCALQAEGFLLRDDPEGTYRLVRRIGTTSMDDFWARAEALRRDAYNERPLLGYFRASARSLAELLRGETDPKQLLFPEARLDLSDSLYRTALFNRWANATIAGTVRKIAEARKTRTPMRVLELGAGAGGTTTEALAALADLGVSYLATDVSPFFVVEVRERFRTQPMLRADIFDINTDPWTQGLAPNSLDLIIAGDVLHNARDAQSTLRWIKALLAPGGWLVFAEMTRDHYQIMTSLEFMNLSDQMAVEKDEQVFFKSEQWLDLLRGAGVADVGVLPANESLWQQIGMLVFVAQFKTDRAVLRSDTVSTWLEDHLPDYMIPSASYVVDLLPLTANGKIDRKAVAAWLDNGVARKLNVSGEEPRNDLEIAIAEAFAGVLRCERVMRDTDFFALGGDSLLAAQLAARLIETIPAATNRFFDDLLRSILEGPTVAELATAFESGQPEPVQVESFETVSPLITLAEGVEASARVFVHGADGTLERLLPILTRCTDGAPRFGLEMRDARTYLQTHAEVVIARTSAVYSKLLIERGCSRFELIGEKFGGLLAVEMARQLIEAGATVTRVTVIDTMPSIAPEDALLVEYFFALELGIDPVALGIPAPQSVFEKVGPSARSGEPLLANAETFPSHYASIRSGAGRDLDGGSFGENSEARLARITSAYDARGADADRMAALSRRLAVFRHSLLAASLHHPAYCAFDIRVVRSLAAPSPWLSDPDVTLRFWSDVALGDLEIVDLADRWPWQTWTAEAARAAGLVA